MSDIHLEDAGFKVSDVEADVVVLAGDIGVGTQGVQWAKESFSLPVIYVAGNHEYQDAALTMDEHMALMKQAAEGSNVTVLDNEGAVIGGVRFLGTTLWTDCKHLLYCDQNILVDSNSDDGCLDADKMNGMFEAACIFLEGELAKPFDGKTVVVTHHAPSMQSIHEVHADNPWRGCYATDIEDVMTGADVWIHGHTHNSFDYRVAGTHIICNPRGYVDSGGSENDAFDGMKVINI